MATKQTTSELDSAKQKNYSELLEFAKYAEQWARFHDHGFRMKAIDVLKKVGEWAG